ncbi:hypothetical protein B5S32_g1811 [[Candida] boidinii]|nr:hypothetical protein B5S32_g1811 [[Candida] boidinii]
MAFLDFKKTIEEGDIALAFIGRDQIKSVVITKGQSVNTRYGVFPHESMIGLPYGSQITSSSGYGFIHILAPTPELWTISLPHRTQIVYTPDSSYIIQRLNVTAGSRVIEAGTGSGSFSHSFARTVGHKGKLFTYEFHEQRYEQAKEEFETHKLTNFEITHRDVCNDGFEITNDETKESVNVDGDIVFLDLPSPQEAIPHLDKVIAKDRVVGICCFSPCFEQVVKTVEALKNNGWSDVELTEVAAKKWEARKDMVREVDDALARLKDVKKRQQEGIQRFKDAKRQRTLKNSTTDTEGSSNETETPETELTEDTETISPDTESSKLEAENNDTKIPEQKGKSQKTAQNRIKDHGFNPFGKGFRVMEGDENYNWFNVSRTGPEIKTHTSYLTFALKIPQLDPK